MTEQSLFAFHIYVVTKGAGIFLKPHLYMFAKLGFKIMQNTYFFIAKTLILGCLIWSMAGLVFLQPASAQTRGSSATGASESASDQGSESSGDQGVSALLSRQQERMDLFELGLKEVRGILEEELRAIKQQLNPSPNSDQPLNGQSLGEQGTILAPTDLASLTTTLQNLNQELARMTARYADIEFRVIRLEKRFTTLLDLLDKEVGDKVAQGDILPSPQTPDVSISRHNRTGDSVWLIEQDKLDEQLAQIDDQNNISASPNTGQDQGAEYVSPDIPILPHASVEDQFRFALTHALQNDLVTAEKAFEEFIDEYPEHERAADALFWLGRVQFIQGQYEKSATTFSKFNTDFSTDARLPDTTLWIAESVAKFAAPEQACVIYASLAEFLDQPPANFLTRLKELSDSAECSG